MIGIQRDALPEGLPDGFTAKPATAPATPVEEDLDILLEDCIPVHHWVGT